MKTVCVRFISSQLNEYIQLKEDADPPRLDEKL